MVAETGMTLGQLALHDGAPSLALVRQTYGRATVRLFVETQLNSLVRFSGVEKVMDDNVLRECADWIVQEFYYLNVYEVGAFVGRMKTGVYGKFYGSVDAMVVLDALRRYVGERNRSIDAEEKRLRDERRDEEIRQRGLNAVTREAYIEDLRMRADGGDERARLDLEAALTNPAARHLGLDF